MERSAVYFTKSEWQLHSKKESIFSKICLRKGRQRWFVVSLSFMSKNLVILQSLKNSEDVSLSHIHQGHSTNFIFKELAISTLCIPPVALRAHRGVFFLITSNCFFRFAFVMWKHLHWHVIGGKSFKSFLSQLCKWYYRSRVELKITPVIEKETWE